MQFLYEMITGWLFICKILTKFIRLPWIFECYSIGTKANRKYCIRARAPHTIFLSLSLDCQNLLLHSTILGQSRRNVWRNSMHALQSIIRFIKRRIINILIVIIKILFVHILTNITVKVKCFS